MLIEVGNAIGIVGLLLTLASFRIGHGRKLSELEPGLISSSKRARAWFKRCILRRRPQTITIQPKSATSTVTFGTPRLSVHENIGPSDAIYIRVEKLAKNIDQLRSDLIHERSESDEIRLSVAAIDTRISEIESSRADEVHDMNQASLTADRWEVAVS